MGEDVSDWLALGGANTAERLRELLSGAPDYRRNKSKGKPHSEFVEEPKIVDDQPNDDWRPDDDGRQSIALRAGKLHEVANEAETVLIAADVPFYARGGEVVRSIIEDVPASKGALRRIPSPAPLNRAGAQ